MRKVKSFQALIAKLADLAAAPFLAAARAFRGRRRPVERVERILAVELWRIGDLVLATPALQALRAAYPEARISLLARPVARTLFLHQTVVDEIIPFAPPWVEHRYDFRRWDWGALLRVLRALRKRRFDVALDFRGDFRDTLLMWLTGASRRVGFGFAGGGGLLTDVVRSRPLRHQADQALDAVAILGAPAGGFGPRLRLSDEEKVEARTWLAAHVPGPADVPLVGLHPGAGWEGRLWEPGRFARVAERLAGDFGARLLLLGGPEDGAVLEAIEEGLCVPHVSTQPSLRRLIALLEACDLLIAPDSGPMHIACAVGTAVVALFGPQRPEWFGPYGDGHLVAIASVPCRPCDQIVCQRPETSCMRLLDVDTVLDLARRQLERRGFAERERGKRGKRRH